MLRVDTEAGRWRRARESCKTRADHLWLDAILCQQNLTETTLRSFVPTLLLLALKPFILNRGGTGTARWGVASAAGTVLAVVLSVCVVPWYFLDEGERRAALPEWNAIVYRP
eukprot:COSAG04_NODE_12241_length_663_cov_0.994681_1_plen_111_part_01